MTRFAVFPMPTDRSERIDRLRGALPTVVPSLLLCDFGHLAEEVRRLEEAGFAALHLDVMDGHFVDNLSYGFPLVKTFRQLTELPLDVHLMIANPGPYLPRYAEAGADLLTVHVEAASRPGELLREIRDLGLGAGLALNPATPLSAIEPLLELCDYVLVMSVEPGYGGQSFQPVALEKLQDLRTRVSPETILAIDGGVKQHNIAQCTAAGARLFVAGSVIFESEDYGKTRHQLMEQVAAGLRS